MTSIAIDRTDGLSSSVAIKGPCRVATTANVTLSGEQTIDGVAVVTDDRVLVKDQTTASENGIYVVDTGTWRRAKDFSRTNDVKLGTKVFVVLGTVNARSEWFTSTFTLLGDDSIAFTRSNQVSTAFMTTLNLSADDAAEARDILEISDPTAYATRTLLKAVVPLANQIAGLVESGREGTFVFRSGDYSTQIAADTLEGIYLKADTIAATTGAWVRQREDFGVNVKWFGAVCDNATDDEPAINAAILALPVTGGTVFIPGPCAIGNTINVGDGTSTVISTRYGIRLVGMTPPNFQKDGNYPVPYSSGFKFIGTAGVTMVSIKGPLVGFSVENLVFDGNSLAGNGLLITSASMGTVQNLTFRGCRYSFMTSCHSSAPYTPDVSAGTDVIRGGNIVIYMPNYTGAVGFGLSGASDGTCSTCFLNLDTIRVYLSTTHVNYGMVFGVTDASTFRNILIIASAAVPAGTYGVLYDYTVMGTFPSGILLDHLDCGWNIPVAQQIINSGSSAGAAGPNIIKNLVELNGGRYPSGITNMVTDQASNRMISYLATDFVGSDVATAQPVFPAAQDAVSLKAIRNYRFRAVYNITRAAGLTSHTTGVLFGGTATFINVDGVAKVSNPTGNVLGALNQISFAVATETVLTAANTAATENVRIVLEGIIRTNAAGTLIPQFKYSAAPGGAPTVKRGSFFEIWPIGEGGQAWTGDWS